MGIGNVYPSFEAKAGPVRLRSGLRASAGRMTHVDPQRICAAQLPEAHPVIAILCKDQAMQIPGLRKRSLPQYLGALLG